MDAHDRHVLGSVSGVLFALLVASYALPAAGVDTGYFQISFTEEDMATWDPDPAVNSGWNETGDGPWFHYTDPPEDEMAHNSPIVPWWNQWYYDGVFDPTRYKIVTVDFDWAPLAQGLPVGGGWVVVNWTNPDWEDVSVGRDAPPIPGLLPDPYNPEDYIERSANLWTYDPNNPVQHVHVEYTIWDYNPEWVSIDVQGINIGITNGVFRHECVPEPFSMVMLGCLGAGMLATRKLTRKQAK